MSEPRPRPKYGEYADVPIVAPAMVALAVETPARARRTWDVVLTAMLLLLGVWDVVTGYPLFAELDVALRSAYEAQGTGVFTADSLATSMGIAINIGRIVLLVAAIVVSFRLITRRRLSFWAPLGASVIAGLLVLVCIFVVVLGDPALAEYAMQQTVTP